MSTQENITESYHNFKYVGIYKKEQLQTVENAQSEMSPKIQKIISSSPPQRVKNKFVWLEAETLKILGS